MASCLTHFAHPKHELKMSDNKKAFICDICYINGTGYRYRCNACDFDMHESCAHYPETISFFAHPWHTLSLVQGTEKETSRCCDLCRDPVQGFFYRCIPCGFDLHPQCSMKLQSERTELHPQHSLTLLPGLSICNACKDYCGIWIYSCGICSVNFHIDCLHGPKGKTEKGDEGSSHSRMKRFLHRVGMNVAVDATVHVVEQTASLLLN